MNSNQLHFVRSHRFLPLTLTLSASLVAISNVGTAHAQCDYYTHPCTTQPTTYANGVIEGPVAPPSGQPANTDLAYTRGHNASVAIDDSETSNNGFVVAWVSDFYRQGCVPNSGLLVEYNKILFSRFDSNGACQLCPRI